MPIDDEKIRHLRECFDRSIGPDATSTVMTMLTSVDVTNLADLDRRLAAGVQSLASITRQLAGGKLRLLAVTSDERLADYPNVPTFSELGIKLPLRGWIGIVGPSGMPRDTTQWINTEIGKLAMQPEFRERMLAPNGVLFVPNTADEFAAFLKASREGFAELLRIVPVKAE